MPPRKPLTARQTLSAELRAYHRMEEADKRAAASALKKIAAGLKRECARIDKEIDALQHQRYAAQTRTWKAENLIKKDVTTKNKGRAHRIAILESRLAAL